MDASFRKSPQGVTFRPSNPAELSSVIDEAFHYRGDITLHLSSGEEISGYVFSRDADRKPASLQLFIPGQAVPRSILYSDILALSFTGEDTASGNDWESWVKKKESERHTEADRIETAARARGHL